jgi:hypothetical protein
MTIGFSAVTGAMVVSLSIHALRGKVSGLRRILVNRHVLGNRHDLTGIVMPARRANVVRALQLAAIAAIGGITRDQRIMSAAHIALGTGDSVLRDSHVSISICLGTYP